MFSWRSSACWPSTTPQTPNAYTGRPPLFMVLPLGLNSTSSAVENPSTEKRTADCPTVTSPVGQLSEDPSIHGVRQGPTVRRPPRDRGPGNGEPHALKWRL